MFIFTVRQNSLLFAFYIVQVCHHRHYHWFCCTRSFYRFPRLHLTSFLRQLSLLSSVGQEMNSSLPVEDYWVSLIGVVVCLLAALQVQLSVRAISTVLDLILS